MPLLTINSTKSIPADDRAPLFEAIAERYADVMDSETRFLSVNFRPTEHENLWLGRADPAADIVILEADIRAGRPPEQRREFALAFMDTIHEEWGIPHPNMKVVFTEHEGSHMMGYDRVGGDWNSTE